MHTAVIFILSFAAAVVILMSIVTVKIYREIKKNEEREKIKKQKEYDILIKTKLNNLHNLQDNLAKLMEDEAKCNTELIKLKDRLLPPEIKTNYIQSNNNFGYTVDKKNSRIVNIKGYKCRVKEKFRERVVEGSLDGKIRGSIDGSGYSSGSAFGYNGILGGSSFGSTSIHGNQSGNIEGNLSQDVEFVFVLEIISDDSKQNSYVEQEVNTDEFYRYNVGDILYCRRFTFTETITSGEEVERMIKLEKTLDTIKNTQQKYLDEICKLKKELEDK